MKKWWWVLKLEKIQNKRYPFLKGLFFFVVWLTVVNFSGFLLATNKDSEADEALKIAQDYYQQGRACALKGEYEKANDFFKKAEDILESKKKIENSNQPEPVKKIDIRERTEQAKTVGPIDRAFEYTSLSEKNSIKTNDFIERLRGEGVSKIEKGQTDQDKINDGTSNNRQYNFLVTPPPHIYSNKNFTLEIKAVDRNNVIVTDYAQKGFPVVISTNPPTKLYPDIVYPADFLNGIAKLETKCLLSGTVSFFVKRYEREKIAYTVGPSDVLGISVWQAEGMEDREVVVSPDGFISFPLIGAIKAEGQSLQKIASIVSDRVAEYVRYPDVTVSLRRMGGRKIILLGEVNSPGVYNISEPYTVIAAIAQGGGVTEDGVDTSVIVLSGDVWHNPSIKIINLKKTLKKGIFSQDLVLNTNDIIYVPRKFIADYYYFMTRVFPGLSPMSFVDIKKNKIP